MSDNGLLSRRTFRRVGLSRQYVPLNGFLPPDSRIALLLLGQIGLGVLALIWGINGGSLHSS